MGNHLVFEKNNISDSVVAAGSVPFGSGSERLEVSGLPIDPDVMIKTSDQIPTPKEWQLGGGVDLDRRWGDQRPANEEMPCG